MSASASSSGESGVGHQPRAACPAGKQEQVPDLPRGAKPRGGTVCAGVTGTAGSLAAVAMLLGAGPWSLAPAAGPFSFLMTPLYFPQSAH